MEQYNLKDDLLPFNIVPVTLNTSKIGVSLGQYVNSVQIINYGLSTIRVNNVITLYPGVPGTRPGDSITFGGNKGELYKGSIDIAFDSAVPANNNCLILQKIYLPDFFKAKI